MRADKRMLFEFPIPASNVKASSSTKSDDEGDEPINLHLFRDHLLSKSNVCQELQSHSLADLRPGQLILHSMNRSITFTQAQQLASLARLTQMSPLSVNMYLPPGIQNSLMSPMSENGAQLLNLPPPEAPPPQPPDLATMPISIDSEVIENSNNANINVQDNP